MVSSLNKQIAQQVARQLGYKGTFADNAAFDKWKSTGKNASLLKSNTAAALQQATVPALQEPLHAWEKSALTGLSNTSGADQGILSGVASALQQLNGGIAGAGQSATTALNAGMAPVTMAEIQGVANPYAENLKAQLSQNAEKIRAQINAGQGLRGARSFGDTSTGVQLGEANTAELNAANQLDYQTFQDALTQINGERNRNLSGGQAFGNLVGANLQGLSSLADTGNTIRTNNIGNLNNQLNAGATVRGYNQNINDILLGNISAGQNYNTANLTNVLGLLKNYQSGANTTGGGTGGITQLGGLATALGGAINPNNLPWL